jgi:predicted DsbA family dithiol-disulfide isomerase
MSKAEQNQPIQIDIISDVMCPWCIIGFRQLEQALAATPTGAFIRWHPFELNPNMPNEGQDLREHVTEKYGASPEQSDQNRIQMQEIGHLLGIDFRFTDNSRIVNTFAAHQLLDWAQSKGLQHQLKMALFVAHFTQHQNVSNHDVLVEVASSVGLDALEARNVLTTSSHAEETRARQQFWTRRGISGVPAMVFEGKYLLTGAQGAETYTQMLQKVLAERTEIAAE